MTTRDRSALDPPGPRTAGPPARGPVGLILLDRERRPRLALRLFLYLAIFMLAAGGLSGLLAGGHPSVGVNVGVHLVGLAVLLAATHAFRRHVDRRGWRDLGLPAPGRRHVASFGAGFGIGTVAIGLSLGLEWALGWARITGTELAERGAVAELGLLAAGLFFYLTSAVMEELVFRGYFFQNLAERLPTGAAALVVGLVFAAGHFVAGVSSPVFAAIAMLDFLLMSCAFLLTRLRTGALWMAIGVHAAWNWGGDYLFGIGTAAEPDYGDALLHVRVSGPGLLVGGVHNADSGLLSILIDVLLIAGCWLVTRRSAAAPTPGGRDRTRGGGDRTRGGGDRTRGGGDRTRGGGDRTRGGTDRRVARAAVPPPAKRPAGSGLVH